MLRITYTLHASTFNHSHFRDPYTVRTPSVKVMFLSLVQLFYRMLRLFV